MKLSFSTRGWEKCGWDQQMNDAADLGFQGIEVYNLHRMNSWLENGGAPDKAVRLAFQYDLEFGIILILAGAVIAAHPTMTLGVISALFGIVTLLDGLFKSRIALESKKFGIEGWWIIMALGIISDVAGVALIIRPTEYIGVISVMLGISLISDGLLNLAVVLETVKIVKNQYPDIIDPEYTETEDDTK